MSSPGQKRKRPPVPLPKAAAPAIAPPAPAPHLPLAAPAVGGVPLGPGPPMFAGHLMMFGSSVAAAAAAAAPPKSAYLKKLEEAKRQTGPQAPAHPGPQATKEQLAKYQDDMAVRSLGLDGGLLYTCTALWYWPRASLQQEFYDQREMDRQSEAIQLSTEQDTESNRLIKLQQRESLVFSGHLARSGCFSRGVLFTQTPFVSFVKWLDTCTVAADRALEFSVCISRDHTAQPWGVLLRSGADLSSPHCVVGGCMKAVCVDPRDHPHARLPLHSPLLPLLSPAAAHAVGPLAGGAASTMPAVAAPSLSLQPGDLITAIGALDLSHCAFEYNGPVVSQAPAAASTLIEPSESWKPRSAAFSAAYLALKLPETRLLLRIRRLPPQPDGGTAAGGASASAAAAAPEKTEPAQRPNWVFFCADSEVRRHVVRLLLLGEIHRCRVEVELCHVWQGTSCVLQMYGYNISSAEHKASKWYAAATKYYMEETLSPRIVECVSSAETTSDELFDAWRFLAASVPGEVLLTAPWDRIYNDLFYRAFLVHSLGGGNPYCGCGDASRGRRAVAPAEITACQPCHQAAFQPR